MTDTVASRELRNDTAGVLRRVTAGESLVITQAQQPVALLSPMPRRRQWVAAEPLWSRLAGTRADSALSGELAAALSERVDEL